VVTLIWRADGLGPVVAALAPRFGAIAILPVHPRPHAPASRILVQGRKDSRTPLIVLPGLFLNDADGRPSQAAEAILRDGAALAMAASGARR
jgi:tRNA1(Val) A37 N6-methylase TrmN6